MAKQFFLFFSTVCSRGRLSNSEIVFIDDSLLLIVRPTLPLMATLRQGTHSQYQKIFLYLAFSVCPTQPIFTNTEREMLSIHSLQTKIKARANLGQCWGCHNSGLKPMSTIHLRNAKNEDFRQCSKKKPGIVSLSEHMQKKTKFRILCFPSPPVLTVGGPVECAH